MAPRRAITLDHVAMRLRLLEPALGRAAAFTFC
jgi:hypothetical protein